MFEKIVAALKEQQSLEQNTQKHDFWTDGYEIICSSQERADVVADLLEDCGEDIVCTTETFILRIDCICGIKCNPAINCTLSCFQAITTV